MGDCGREGAEKLMMLFSIQDFGFEHCFVVAICYSLIDVTEEGLNLKKTVLIKIRLEVHACTVVLWISNFYLRCETWHEIFSCCNL